ncbi:hypothetical protein ABTW24_08780 [Sphingobacterium thalpophilum]|uniref:Uncharacterized protein n=1 Tax=Sphingobacterium thalpophilum TaxID=259 RepID=A0ABV4HB20_9SPHI|nr:MULTISPECIES: hypothetical protein [Sphingobacterium]
MAKVPAGRIPDPLAGQQNGDQCGQQHWAPVRGFSPAAATAAGRGAAGTRHQRKAQLCTTDAQPLG